MKVAVRRGPAPDVRAGALLLDPEREVEDLRLNGGGKRGKGVCLAGGDGCRWITGEAQHRGERKGAQPERGQAAAGGCTERARGRGGHWRCPQRRLPQGGKGQPGEAFSCTS